MGQESELPPLILRKAASRSPQDPSASEELSTSLDEVQSILQQDAVAEKARVASLLREPAWGGPPHRAAGAPGGWIQQEVQPLPLGLAPPGQPGDAGEAGPVPGASPFAGVQSPAGAPSTHPFAPPADVLAQRARKRQRRRTLLLLLGAGCGLVVLVALLVLGLWLLLSDRGERRDALVGASGGTGTASPEAVAGAEAAATTTGGDLVGQPAAGAVMGEGAPAPAGGAAARRGVDGAAPGKANRSPAGARRQQPKVRPAARGKAKPQRPRTLSEVEALLEGL
ncbi:MAG: hypothetical protein FJ125_03335 [Deltaproteobacteria bacterium]|nr:hypothetical protein [Deltaproteobacteria bacterium]